MTSPGSTMPQPLQSSTRRPTRAVHLALLLVTVALGLASRRWAGALPAFIGAYAGDTLWAAAAYWTLSAAIPSVGRLRRGGLAFSIAAAVEVSQIFHPAWLDAVRRTRLGGWLLGFGFLWSDVACYAVGVGLAMAVDRLLAARRSAWHVRA